ncbi:MAG: ATP-binding cassette domain-containing protein [Asgard group archaeon]|nr:ATP-binding cassette domain-containing protein [Asgard group archaeon]
MIEFKNVYFSYQKGIEVLHDISLKINSGEFVAIIGKNGAGKSTLAKHVNGLLRPTKGAVFLNDKDIAKKPLSALAKEVGLAFQNPDHQLFAESVEKELAFGPLNLGFSDEECQKKVRELANFFDIEHLLPRSPFSLSGGEKRLVSIASVLTMGQKILILDEPTFGQDQKQKNLLGQLLQELNDKGLTIVIISHDLDFVLSYSTRVVILQDGEIIADGKPLKILQEKSFLQEAGLRKPFVLEIIEEIQSIKPDFPLVCSKELVVKNLNEYFFQRNERRFK